MSKLEFDPRPKRTNLVQMPCLADPNLACVPECRMYDYDDRVEVLSEVNLDLPPLMEVLREHGTPDDPDDKQKRRIYIINHNKIYLLLIVTLSK